MICIFFFKQKTAYEMRISDWSSDVCSSDLVKIDGHAHAAGKGHFAHGCQQTAVGAVMVGQYMTLRSQLADDLEEGTQRDRVVDIRNSLARSEEHTSELQSLMRISYAVFCLKKTSRHVIMPLLSRQIT